MAVLVQHLIPADAAGVAFTANPVTGGRGEVLVSAVRGLGDRLVSGEATPDEWTVSGDEARCLSAPEGALDVAVAGTVAELAKRVEQHFGVPQDIEWAIADGTLYLLQARPITTGRGLAIRPPASAIRRGVGPAPGNARRVHRGVLGHPHEGPRGPHGSRRGAGLRLPRPAGLGGSSDVGAAERPLGEVLRTRGKLSVLAQMARERPSIRDLLDRPGPRAVERLLEVDVEFADAFDAFLSEFGCRALRYEVAEPTLEGTPALVLKLICDQVLRPRR